MEIVVVDNLNWANEGVGLLDPRPEYLVTSEKSYEGVVKDLSDFSDVYGASGELVYLINVHCVFSGGDSNRKETSYYSDQNGVRIYRNLLKRYENCQHNLKVAFFSPIPKLDLTRLRPENVVFEHHLVFQTPFEWVSVVNKIREWNQNHRWKTFNNASENLLSGWSLLGCEKIVTNGKRFVFVDDQADEWETTLKTIVADSREFHFAKYYKENNPSGMFSPEKIIDPKRGDSSLFRTKVHQADLVISDFYLQENHEIHTWKSYEELAGISGYRLFQYLKNEMKVGVPVVMHTSSNKVRSYQFLDRHGIDDWISKDTRADASKMEKQYNYQQAKKVIEKFTIGEHAKVYEQLKDIWRRIERIEKRGKTNWWFSDSDYSCAPENDIKKLFCGDKKLLIEILTDAFFGIRGYLKREDLFSGKSTSRYDHFAATAIAVNLGKIYELFEFPDGGMNQYQRFFREVRNAAAHYHGCRYFSIEDTLLYFHYWLRALEDDSKNVEEMFTTGPTWPLTFPKDAKFRILYLWILFYNSAARPSRGDGEADLKILGRITSMLEVINHRELFDELSRDEVEFRNVKKRIVPEWNKSTSAAAFNVRLESGKIKLKLVEGEEE